MAGSIPGLSGGSGIDTETIIDSIIQQRSRRITLIEDRISKAEEQKRAFLDINSRLLNIQETAKRLANGASFSASVVRSNKPDVLLATGDTSEIEGTFQFYTKSLASVSQFVSNGFADTGTSRVTSVPGKITIEVGDSGVNRPSDLDSLNGGTGIDRGRIRVTDDGGRTAIVDLSFAVTLDDVVDAINNNGIAQVIAEVNNLPGTGLSGDGLVIRNLSGTGSVSVANVGLGQSATSLGIEGTDGSGVLVGTRINTIGRNTQLASLNDGRGVGDGSIGTVVVSVTDSSGTRNVDISAAKTIGEVLDLVNNSGGAAGLAISADGRRLVLRDTVTPSPTLAMTETTATGFLRGLGLDTALQTVDAAAGTITGSKLTSALNSVRLDSLGGAAGTGFAGATTAVPHVFEIMDSMGAVTSVVYTGEESLSDLVTRINNPMGPGANVLAKIDPSGTGIQLTDLAAGPAQLTVTDIQGTVAAGLGIAGVHADGLAEGGNLNFRYLHANRLLADFGLDEGFISGRVELVDRAGVVRQVDLSNVRSLGDVVRQLNATPSVTVGLSPYGDGLRFTDLSGGTGQMTVRDVSGTIMRKLGLAGTYANQAVVDKRREYEVDVSATDTLADVVSKIQGLAIPVTATTVNDGQSSAGFRLSISGKGAGAKNAITVRSDLASLSFGQTSKATDAVMLYGNAEGTADPVVVRSSTNTFKRVLPGVTLDLLGVTQGAVTVSITKDLQAASNDINDLVEGYNSLASRVDELAGFDPDTQEGGPLLGNGTVQRLEFDLVAALIDPVTGLPLGANTLSGFGIIRKPDGTFEVNQEKLLAALDTRFEELRDIFSNTARLDPDTKFQNFNDGKGLTTGSGADIRISFADGSADLEVDLDGMDRLGQLLDLINNDGRALAEVSPDGRRIRIRDLTAPNGTSQFTVASANNTTAASSLGLLRTTPLPGSSVLETKAILLNTNLGVARRVDSALTKFTQNDGLISDATKSLDEKVKGFNENIEKLEERIDAERTRLERQFRAMEAALSESQAASNQLSQQFTAINNANKK